MPHVITTSRADITPRLTPRQALAYCEHLLRKDTDALGWLPRAALREAIDQGRVYLCWHNASPVGYILHGRIKPILAIYQVAVAKDARRILHGTALVDAVAKVAKAHGIPSLRLRCGVDLPAMQFWQALGFVEACRVKGGARRRRVISIMARAALAPELEGTASLPMPSLAASCGPRHRLPARWPAYDRGGGGTAPPPPAAPR